jgi:hypothetical protein
VRRVRPVDVRVERLGLGVVGEPADALAAFLSPADHETVAFRVVLNY